MGKRTMGNESERKGTECIKNMEERRTWKRNEKKGDGRKEKDGKDNVKAVG